eukprot:COSAG02_NODE_4835_length_4923_cov_20.132670_1_plen_162_part_00
MRRKIAPCALAVRRCENPLHTDCLSTKSAPGRECVHSCGHALRRRRDLSAVSEQAESCAQTTKQGCECERGAQPTTRMTHARALTHHPDPVNKYQSVYPHPRSTTPLVSSLPSYLHIHRHTASQPEGDRAEGGWSEVSTSLCRRRRAPREMRARGGTALAY